MVSEKSKFITPIKPLFLPIEDSGRMGRQIIHFATDDYNKAIGSALIDATDDVGKTEP